MAEKFNVIVERDITARMRDGTELSANIWRPDADGQFPVLLCRTPYDKKQPSGYTMLGIDPVRSVSEGYVVIYQDVRGRGSSEGDWSFKAELDDGYDSVEWAGSLPCSDGNVGMFGFSYVGFTQWMAAIARPPYLKAIFPMQMASGMRDFIYPSGAFALGSALWWGATQALSNLVRRARDGEDITSAAGEVIGTLDNIHQAYLGLPVGQTEQALIQAFPELRDWLLNGENAAFWEDRAFGHRLDVVDLPAYHLGSWNDIYPGPVPAIFAEMKAEAPSEATRRAQKLLMGPWTHGMMGSDVVGDLYVGISATAGFIDLPGLHLRWFDHWLKGKNSDLMQEPPVRIFVMGENKWRSESEWPLERTMWTKFYLHSAGCANTRDGDGRLELTPPTSHQPYDSYLYDPRNPVPTVGGPTVLPGVGIGANAGPKDQYYVESRHDVLVYSTPTLPQDIEITGPVLATLFITSSATDTDFTVKLVDVYPDGRAYNMADGLVRARYRNDTGRSELLRPGDVYELQVDLQCTSNVFKAGHRIRMQVSSSNFPRFSRNSNTGDALATDVELSPAMQTILHQPGTESHITLPVIPR